MIISAASLVFSSELWAPCGQVYERRHSYSRAYGTYRVVACPAPSLAVGRFNERESLSLSEVSSAGRLKILVAQVLWHAGFGLPWIPP
jgi:hypothetical protein